MKLSYKKLLDIVFRFFQKEVDPESKASQKLHPVYFQDISACDKVPSNSVIEEKQFVYVVYKEVPRWAMFKCPCGCGATISLPLQKPHSPRWSVEVNRFGRPTLYPSVWQNKGCKSHFIIRDGRVMWCDNTGSDPYETHPEIYSQTSS